MANNKFATAAERGEPLKVSELVPGEYYEDILTEQRVLVHSKNDVPQAHAVYYNKVSGIYTDFQVSDNQLRKWK